MQRQIAEENKTFTASFLVLDRVAMQGLMSSLEVSQYLSELESYFDEERLKEAFGQ